MTVGSKIAKDGNIDKKISDLVGSVTAQSKELAQLRGANTDLTDQYEKLMNELNEVRGRPIFYPYVGSGAGSGPYVELCDGSVKLDLINGIGVHIYGHGHPVVLEGSVRGALQDIVMQGHLEMNEIYKDFSETIISLAKKGSRLRHGWISPSGSMANENALKMARQKNSPARKVLAMKDAFSGRTTMMAELTDNPAYKVGLPEYHEVLRVPFYDKHDPQSIDKSVQAIREAIAKNPKDISCFCFEPVLGEGGYKVAPREFFLPMFEECRKAGIAIWADEVQTFLRTGEPFAFQTLDFGDYVDIVTIAKTAQAGMTLYTEEYNPQPGLIAGTFASSSAALGAGLAIIEDMKKTGSFGKEGKIAKIHNEFVEGLSALCQGSCKGYLEDPEGLGLMVAVTPFSGDKNKVMALLKTMFNNGLIAFGCGKNPFRLRFLVPAIIESKDIQVALKVIEKSILELKDSP